jgi:hypothetical protein
MTFLPLSSPHPLYRTSSTQFEDGLFLKSKWLLESIPFHSTNKAATLPFSIVEEKIFFLFNYFYYTEKTSGKQFLRIRNLYEAPFSFSTSSASIKARSRVRLNAVVHFLLNKGNPDQPFPPGASCSIAASSLSLAPVTALVPYLKSPHHRPSMPNFLLARYLATCFEIMDPFA